MSAELIACSFCCLIIGLIIGFAIAGNEYEKDLKSYKNRFKNILNTSRKGSNGEMDKDTALLLIQCESDLVLPGSDHIVD